MVHYLQHFTNVFASDCVVIIALCALYCLADAAENSRLDSDTYQRLAAAVLLYTASTSAAVVLAAGLGAADGSPAPSAAAVAAIVLASAPAAAASASAMMKYGGGLGAAVELGVDDFKAAAAGPYEYKLSLTLAKVFLII